MKKTYTAELKRSPELEHCEKGRHVALLFHTGEEYHGIFRGFDDENTIMLRSEGEKPITIGLPYDRLKFWLLKDK